MKKEKAKIQDGFYAAEQFFECASKACKSADCPVFTQDEKNEAELRDYEGRTALVTEKFIPGFLYRPLKAQTCPEEEAFATLAKIDDGLFVSELYDCDKLSYRAYPLSVMPAAMEYICGGAEKIMLLTADYAENLVGADRICESSVETFAFYPAGCNELCGKMLAGAEYNGIAFLPAEVSIDAAEKALLNFSDSPAVQELLQRLGKKQLTVYRTSLLSVIPLITVFLSVCSDLATGGETECGKKITFFVPENCPDLVYAGILAKKAGLPVEEIVYAGECFDAFLPESAVAVAVTEKEKAAALRYYYEEYGIITDSASAAALAALDKHCVEEGTLSVVLSARSPYTDAGFALRAIGEASRFDMVESAEKLENLTAFPVPEKILAAKRLKASVPGILSDMEKTFIAGLKLQNGGLR